VPPLVHNLVVQPQKRQPEQISGASELIRLRELFTDFGRIGLPGIVYNELTSEDVLAFPPQSAIGLAGDVYELIPDDAQAIIKEIIGRMVLIDPYDANTHQPFVTIPIS
jgi:hypothetical protein